MSGSNTRNGKVKRRMRGGDPRSSCNLTTFRRTREQVTSQLCKCFKELDTGETLKVKEWYSLTTDVRNLLQYKNRISRIYESVLLAELLSKFRKPVSLRSYHTGLMLSSSSKLLMSILYLPRGEKRK